MKGDASKAMFVAERIIQSSVIDYNLLQKIPDSLADQQIRWHLERLLCEGNGALPEDGSHYTSERRRNSMTSLNPTNAHAAFYRGQTGYNYQPHNRVRYRNRDQGTSHHYKGTPMLVDVRGRG